MWLRPLDIYNKRRTTGFLDLALNQAAKTWKAIDGSNFQDDPFPFKMVYNWTMLTSWWFQPI